MSIYMSRAELEEISEDLIKVYNQRFYNRMIQSIDIEHFITEFLMLKIEYTSFAEDDAGRIGFLADGETPLLIHQEGKIIPFVFPKDTIVLDKFLLSEKKQGRRRFTMAHEASHHMLHRLPGGFILNMTANAAIPKRNWRRCLPLSNGRRIQWEFHYLCRNALSTTLWQSSTNLSQ